MSGVYKVLPDQDLGKLIVTAYPDSTSASFSSLSSLPCLATPYITGTALSQPLNGWFDRYLLLASWARLEQCNIWRRQFDMRPSNIRGGLARDGEQSQALAEVKKCYPDISWFLR